MTFRNLGLRTRLYCGFGLLIVISLALAGYGAYGLSNVGGEVGKLDAVAGNVVRVLKTQIALQTLRQAGEHFRINADETSAQDMVSNETRAASLLADSAANTLSETRRKTYNGVADSLRAFTHKREEFTRLIKTAVDARAKLFTGGDALTAATARAMQAAATDNNADELAAAAHMESAMLLVRVANWRFLATFDPNGVTTFNTNARKASDALAALEPLAGPGVKSLLAPVRTELAAYETNFNIAAPSFLKAFTLFDSDMRTQILAMQAETDKAAVSLDQSYRQTTADAFSDTRATTTLQAIVALVGALLGVALALFLGRGIIRPLAAMTTAMTSLAAGHHDIDVPARDQTDEIGAMARAVEVFKENAIANDRLKAAQEKLRADKDRRQAAIDTHTQDFGTSVSGVMTSLITSAETMREAALKVANGAQRTRSSTSSSVDGAAASSQDLNAVAAAAEEMAASIGEINQQVSHVTTAVHRAVAQASTTDGKVASLAEAADRIGDVVRLINDIAGQTNLLALNATIEAARAGDAGKGFAVVAGEVKALAAQTAKATDQISAQIVAIRGATGEAVSAVRDVSSAISEVETVATAIAAAVEQQATATREITNSVQTVTVATNGAMRSMQDVLEIAEETDVAGQSVLTATADVGRTADTLREEVNDFLAAMRRVDENERRQYERINGRNAPATVSIDGKPETRAKVLDISRGGVALSCDLAGAVGAEVKVILPGVGGPAPARIVRSQGGVLAVAFRQDPATISRIDKAIEAITHTMAAAA